jgi:hypothetical protein
VGRPGIEQILPEAQELNRFRHRVSSARRAATTGKARRHATEPNGFSLATFLNIAFDEVFGVGLEDLVDLVQ